MKKRASKKPLKSNGGAKRPAVGEAASKRVAKRRAAPATLAPGKASGSVTRRKPADSTTAAAIKAKPARKTAATKAAAAKPSPAAPPTPRTPVLTAGLTGATLERALDALIVGESEEPFDVLGPHENEGDAGGAPFVRAFLPHTTAATLNAAGERIPMTHRREEGVFEASLPAGLFDSGMHTSADAGDEPLRGLDYRFEWANPEGFTVVSDDPYRFAPRLTAFDLHLFGEGTHERLYERMGAQVVHHEGADGVNFAVWAPNAKSVSVVGDFNRWDARTHPMRQRGHTGVWELFVPGLGNGTLYKYAIRSQLGELTQIKTDPYGFFMELRPHSASIVWDLSRFTWSDEKWLAARAERQGQDRPVAIYEVHAGSWKRHDDGGFLSWRELAEQLIPYARDMGYTHLELLPVNEHPLDASWGYQPVGHFAPTSRHGNPDEFRHFVNEAHRAGLGVIVDWVPAHFPKDGHGLGLFDGTHLYEHADPRKGEHKDWGTYVYNFARPQVSGFLLASALFWLERYHVDGLRVDAVASMLYLDYSRNAGEWTPNVYGGRENLEAIEFLKRFNWLVHKNHPGILTCAEESTQWPRVTGPVEEGGLGFDLKWNMGWMNDMLAYMRTDPIGRSHHQGKLTFSLYYAYSERFLLPLSHDEVVHGKRSLLLKMPGELPHKFANLRMLHAYLVAHPGKKLTFMGAEFGQPWEWNFERPLGWKQLELPDHAGLQAFVRELLHVYRDEPALHEVDFHWEGFQWIDFQDASQSVVSFVRRARDPQRFVVVVANFTPVARERYRIGAPSSGRYQVLLDSDEARWGGTGTGLASDLVAKPVPMHGFDQSLELTLPPLSVLILEPVAAPRVAAGGASTAEPA